MRMMSASHHAAVVGGDRAQDQPDDDRDGHRDHADGQRDAGAVDRRAKRCRGPACRCRRDGRPTAAADDCCGHRGGVDGDGVAEVVAAPTGRRVTAMRMTMMIQIEAGEGQLVLAQPAPGVAPQRARGQLRAIRRLGEPRRAASAPVTRAARLRRCLRWATSSASPYVACPAVADARIEERVADVHQQVDDHDHEHDDDRRRR